MKTITASPDDAVASKIGQNYDRDNDTGNNNRESVLEPGPRGWRTTSSGAIDSGPHSTCWAVLICSNYYRLSNLEGRRQEGALMSDKMWFQVFKARILWSDRVTSILDSNAQFHQVCAGKSGQEMNLRRKRNSQKLFEISDFFHHLHLVSVASGKSVAPWPSWKITAQVQEAVWSILQTRLEDMWRLFSRDALIEA